MDARLAADRAHEAQRDAERLTHERHIARLEAAARDFARRASAGGHPPTELKFRTGQHTESHGFMSRKQRTVTEYATVRGWAIAYHRSSSDDGSSVYNLTILPDGQIYGWGDGIVPTTDLTTLHPVTIDQMINAMANWLVEHGASA